MVEFPTHCCWKSILRPVSERRLFYDHHPRTSCDNELENEAFHFYRANFIRRTSSHARRVQASKETVEGNRKERSDPGKQDAGDDLREAVAAHQGQLRRGDDAARWDRHVSDAR